MIIAFAGVRGSGKDTAGRYLESFYGFELTSFAAPLKKAAQICFPILTDRQLFGETSAREEPLDIPLRGFDPRTGDAMTRTEAGWIAEDGTHYPAYLTPRLILQTLGTEWGRRLHQDVWVTACLDSIPHDEQWAITDCRFRNEIKAVNDKDGFVILLKRGYHEAKTRVWKDGADVHPSEAELLSLPLYAFDYILDNDGSIEALPALLDAALAKLGVLPIP